MCVSWTLDGFIGVIRGLLVPLLGLSCLRHDYNNNLTAQSLISQLHNHKKV